MCNDVSHIIKMSSKKNYNLSQFILCQIKNYIFTFIKFDQSGSIVNLERLILIYDAGTLDF